MVHYDKLVEIYATDLAKGHKVKGPGEQLEMDEDQPPLNGAQVGSQTVEESASHSQSQGNTPSSSRQSLKRKSTENDPLEVEFIQLSKSICSLLQAEKENTLSMNYIKKAFAHEADIHEQTSSQRKDLFQVLCTLPDLTPEQVVKATRLIGQDAVKMDLFLSMPDNYKVIFAQQEIERPN